MDEQAALIADLRRRVEELESRLDGYGDGIEVTQLTVVDSEGHARVHIEGGTIAVMDRQENARIFISSQPVALTVLRERGIPRLRLLDTSDAVTIYDRHGRAVAGFTRRSCYANNLILRESGSGRLRGGMWVQEDEGHKIAFVAACDDKGQPLPGLACREDGVGGVFGNVKEHTLKEIPGAPKIPSLTVLQGGRTDDDDDDDDTDDNGPRSAG